MTKYLISTLTAAAAMAVPAFSAELIGSWDFSTYQETTSGGLGSVQSSVSYDGGDNYLVLNTGSDIAYGGAGTYTGYYLNIKSSNDYTNKTTIDVSNANVTLDEGICIVLTIVDLSGGDRSIFAAIETEATNGNEYVTAAAIGESSSDTTTTGGGRGGYFMANGGVAGATTDQTLPGINMTYPMTLALTFEGDTMGIYQLQEDGSYTLVAQGVINESTYNTVNGLIEEVAIASWDGTSTGNEFTILGVSKLDIYALPEPSMFGLLFGLGAIGLVATRRRRKVA